MPRNVSGVYSLPAGNPVVSGTTIDSTWANDTMSDIGSEITGSLPRNGSAPMTGPLILASDAVQSLGATTLQQLNATAVTKDSGTGAAQLPAGTTAQRPGSPVYGQVRANSTLNQTEWYNGVDWVPMGGEDGITQGDADNRYVNVIGDTMTGNMVVEGGAAFLIKRDPATQAGYFGFHNMAGNLRGYMGYGSANENLTLQDNLNTNSYLSLTQSPADAYLAGSNRIKFVTSGVQRFDISEQFLVTAGNTPTSYGNGTYLSNTGVMSLGLPAGTTPGSGYVLFGLNGMSAGSITLGTGNTVQFNTSSDYRLKDGIKDLTGSGAFIDALQPREWTWKVDGSKGVGFVAHEAAAVVSSAVYGTKDAKKQKKKDNDTFEEVDDFQQMCYSSPELIGNIVAELKSLRVRVAKLEGKAK